MAEVVYVLCALTSCGCALLLLKSYQRTKARLLFWSFACFACLALTNILLFVDLVMVPAHDLMLLRNSINLAGLLVLLYGLIWETS
jgi:hypothetical protein